jgi:ribonucleoside-diphosphate reductase alpha chain
LITVTKRNGTKEPLDLNKLHRVTTWACQDLTGVSSSEVEIRSNLSFYDKIKTSDIQETLIKAASELISEDHPNYQYVAGRLINYHLRKTVYGEANPTAFAPHVKRVVEAGFYDSDILNQYTEEELTELGSYIKHDRDLDLTYAAMEQFRGKYLVRDKKVNKYYETPQIVYMMIAATLFSGYPKEKRMYWVKEYYDAISTHEISLPTPIMAGVRTPQRQFSSCVVIESGDSLDSINAAVSSIVKYVSQRAGIGIGAGRIRALGSSIRNGDTLHTGVIPFYKLFQAAVKSCSQGGVRGGAATLYYPIWHLEVEDLLVLKNNKGTEDTRARGLDYGVQFSKLFYERLLAGGNITLFSPSDVPGLYDAFFQDQAKFEELYVKAESNKKIRKKTIKALDLFSAFVQERKDTGRIYLMNVDHCNDHSSFITEKAPIRLSNLCTEITLPTNPMNDIYDDVSGEIALCTLSAINWGKIKKPDDFQRPCELAVRGLDALLTYQNYPMLAAETGAAKRRALGIGIINLAYWLAKNDLTYQNITKEGLQKIHEWTEAWSFYLIDASVTLAEEFGPCGGFDETKYSLGLFPKDTYKKDVDELVDPVYKMDWEVLGKRVVKSGIRNSTLMALMPAETSAQLANATNGVEPPRALVSIKQSKDGVLAQVVPEIRKLKNKYDLLWDQESPVGYLKIMAVLQKFIDQSISVNTSYNPAHYEDEQVPMSELLKHLLLSYKWGTKCLYYNNTNDAAGEVKVELPQAVVDEEDCDACKI